MLSIIIPTLNEENYLPLLLESIKKQNFDDYEIIVADDGSEDKTVEIAKRYGCKIVKRGGLPAKGRNEGAKIAKGDIFLFMDADNIFLPSKFLENLLAEFKSRNLDVASFPVYPASISGENGGGVYPQGKIIDKIAYWAYNLWVKLIQNILPHATNAVLIKKEIHQTMGGFDEEIKIGEDHVYVRRARKFGKFGFIETEPVLTSTRRFERDGRLKTYLKYLIAGAYMIFLGPVKSDIFKYRFNRYSPPKLVRGSQIQKKGL